MTNRELDALFAEKVLGCKVHYNEGVDYACKCGGDTPHGSWDNCCGFHRDYLTDYTASLDAVWTGMQQLPLAVSECRRLWEDTSDGSHPYHAEVGNAYACSDHPAKALVLACLRAVGVDCD